jgi:hypothetical protein
MTRKAIWLSVGAVALAVCVWAVVFGITHTNGSSGPSLTPSGDVVPQSHVVIVDDCNNAGRVEPRTIQLTCGDGSAVASDLAWSRWSASAATGHGVINQVSCVPNCASGKDVAYRVDLTLSKPVRTQNGAVDFTRIVVTFLGKSPDGVSTVAYSDCFAKPPAFYLPKCP